MILFSRFDIKNCRSISCSNYTASRDKKILIETEVVSGVFLYV